MKKTMEDYIRETSRVLKDNLKKTENILFGLIDELAKEQFEKIMIVASGSSYNAAICAEDFMQSYFGKKIEIKTPFSFFHYEVIDSSYAYLFVSQSGSSTNIIDALKKCKTAGRKTIAIVGNKKCTMGKIADRVFEYGVGEEKVGYVTKGMSTLTLFFMMFAMECSKKRVFGKALLKDIDKLCEEDKRELDIAVENYYKVYEYAQQFCDDNKKSLLSMKHVFFLSCGANRGTIREAALKVAEMVHVQTNEYEVEEFLHGPDLQLTPEYTLFFVDAGGETSKRIKEIFEASKEVTDHTYCLSEGNMSLEHTKEKISPIYFTAFFQYLAYYVAKELNIMTEHPLFSQFEDKVFCKTEDYVEDMPF